MRSTMSLPLGSALSQEEREAFELRVVLEAGPDAAELNVSGNYDAGYASERINDYRLGWVACLDWMASRTAQPNQGDAKVEVVAWRYQPNDGLKQAAYSEREAQALAFDAAPVALVRQDDHLAALATVTAERDMLRRDRKACWAEFKALVKSSCEKERYLQDEIDQLRAERAGKVLLPAEPTIEMIAALGFGGDVALAVGHAAVCEDVEQTYRALIAAASAAKDGE